MIEGFGLSGSWIDEDLVMIENSLVILPFGQLAKIITSQKKAKLMLRILIHKVGKRIDGIAWLGHAKLHIGSSEMIMIRNRQLDHFQPIKLMNQGLAFFEWVLRTYHKPNFFQIGTIIQDIGNDQVPDMNWIEAAEIKPDFHEFNLLEIF